MWFSQPSLFWVFTGGNWWKTDCLQQAHSKKFLVKSNNQVTLKDARISA